MQRLQQGLQQRQQLHLCCHLRDKRSKALATSVARVSGCANDSVVLMVAVVRHHGCDTRRSHNSERHVHRSKVRAIFFLHAVEAVICSPLRSDDIARTIYVGNLGPEMTTDAIEEFFKVPTTPRWCGLSSALPNLFKWHGSGVWCCEQSSHVIGHGWG